METVTSHDGFEVTSSHEAADDMRAALAAVEPVEKTEPEEIEPPIAAKVATPEAKPVDKRTREGRKLSIQQEIDELTTAKHTTARERDEIAAQVTSLRAEMADLQRQRQAPREEPKPQAPEKFPSYQDMLAQNDKLTPEEWLDQRDEWRDSKRAEMQARQASEASHMGRVKTFNEKITASEAAEPGFWASVKPFADQLVPAKELPKGQPVTGRNAVADVILDSEISDKLLRHFRDTPADFQRISTLHPMLAIREMGKLEERLSAASSTGPALKAPVISQAKAPLKPVSASPVISDNDAPEEDLDFDDFVKKREAQIRRTR